MKHFNLFSAIALFCLAAGFVSCTKTVNDDPNFGQDEGTLYLIDKETNTKYPDIYKELVGCGLSAEVCDMDKLELSSIAANYPQVLTIGAKIPGNDVKPGDEVCCGYAWMGSTTVSKQPQILVIAGITEAKASSGSTIKVSPDCHELMKEMAPSQVAQIEANIASMIRNNANSGVRLSSYRLDEFKKEAIPEATRASEISLFPFSGEFVTEASLYSKLPTNKSGSKVDIQGQLKAAILLANLVIGSVYFENGDVLLCEEGKAEAERKSSKGGDYRQINLLEDLEEKGGEYVIEGVIADNRLVAYYVKEKGQVYVKSGDATTEEEIVEQLLKKTFKVIDFENYNFPLTLTEVGQHLVISKHLQYEEVPDARSVIMPRAMTLAATIVAAEAASIEVSNAAVELLKNSEINQAKGRAFDAYFSEHAATKEAINLLAAKEIKEAESSLRSGEKVEAVYEYLPMSPLTEACVVEECSLLKAETGSEDIIRQALSDADLIICLEKEVPEVFCTSRNVAYDFAQCDYTVDGKKYTSFMDAVEKLASTGRSSIGIDAPTSIPMGALPGKFTVNGNGKQVYFSKGNLWYGKAEGVEAETFNFENEQWEFQPASNGAWNENHVSHFYWSKDASIACAQKYEDSTASGNDTFFTNAATGFMGFWVREAPTVNYFSLSMDEWEYLINLRTSAEEGAEKARYAKATIVDENTSVTGLILFPDEFSVPEDVMFPSGINTASSSFDTNSYTTAEWKKFEIAGAVFLPAAGARDHTNNYIHNVGLECYYCSSSPCDNDTGVAHALYFHQNIVDTRCTIQRNNGCCIRLVTEVE